MRRSYVVVLFLVVVGLLAVLLRGRQETHPPLVESGDLSDGVGARVEPAVASINSALAQAEKPILAVPIQRIKVVVKRQLSELDARDKKSMALVNYVLKDAGKPEILSTASISLEDLEVLREIIGQNAKSVDAAEGVLTKHADQVLSEARASLEARLARGETTGLPLQSGENSMRRRHPFEAISSIELAGRRYIVRVHPKDDDRLAGLGDGLASANKSYLANALASVMFVLVAAHATSRLWSRRCVQTSTASRCTVRCE
jgi:hypothetical protein